MNTLIGAAITAWAAAGEWLLLPLGLAAGYGLYRLIALAVRRSRARRAEAAARYLALEPSPADDAAELTYLEALYTAPDATHRNTRKENQ